MRIESITSTTNSAGGKDMGLYIGSCWMVKVKHMPQLTTVCLDRAARDSEAEILRRAYGDRVTIERFRAQSTKPGIVAPSGQN